MAYDYFRHYRWDHQLCRTIMGLEIGGGIVLAYIGLMIAFAVGEPETGAALATLGGTLTLCGVAPKLITRIRAGLSSREIVFRNQLPR